MGELPEGVRGRVLAVLLLVTALAALWAGVAVPLSDWYASRTDRLGSQAVLARRMTQIAAELPELRRRAASSVAVAPVPVLEGGSDAVAGASLQGRLQQIGAGTGATLTSTEVLPTERVGAYRRIGVRLAVSAPWPVMVRLLQAITSGSPRLLVNDLQIQGGRLLIGDAEPALTTTMVVFGFRADTPS